LDQKNRGNILVTGGAGYVGSIVSEELSKNGYQVIIMDNLQQGHREAVPRGTEFIHGDISDTQALEQVFKQNNIDAVMHMAAETVVEYSMSEPKRFFHSNVVGGINLLDAMLRHDVSRLIFSSSAAVYGEARSIPIEEEAPQNPTNAYGESKLMFEHILKWYEKAYGLKYISLRYFNCAGASNLLGEDHHPETHLISNILRVALNRGNPVPIFGTDYPTKDGTCVRDYVHVLDIAQAQLLALQRLSEAELSSEQSSRVYNLGTGEGYSVLEVIDAARRITRDEISVRDCPRRRGDPAVLVASSKRARQELGWQPKFQDLDSIIRSAWNWMSTHPNGYER